MTDVPTPERSDLLALRQQGMSRQEIAAYYGVNLSRVKRWIRDLEIPAAFSKTRKQKVRTAQDDGLTVIERARLILGKRMGEDYRGYLLDGRPVRVDVLVRSAGLTIPDIP